MPRMTDVSCDVEIDEAAGASPVSDGPTFAAAIAILLHPVVAVWPVALADALSRWLATEAGYGSQFSRLSNQRVIPTVG